jgi:hypothetical protein
MIYYHRTTPDAARAILANGFRDGSGTYMTDREWTGVWISDRPLDGNEGAVGDILLAVWVPDDVSLDEWEWVEDGKTYREWLIPAATLNRQMRVWVEECDDPEYVSEFIIRAVPAGRPPKTP